MLPAPNDQKIGETNLRVVVCRNKLVVANNKSPMSSFLFARSKQTFLIVMSDTVINYNCALLCVGDGYVMRFFWKCKYTYMHD